MKFTTILLTFLLSVSFSLAQSVSLANPSITSSPLNTLENNGAGVFSFALVESSATDVPASGFGQSNVTVSVDLNYVELTNSDVSLITGTFSDYFSVSYNEQDGIITFSQTAIIEGDAAYVFEIPVTVTINSAISQALNGFTANISALDSTTNAEGNAYVFTYTEEAVASVEEINQNNADSDISVFPNPFKDVLEFSYNSNTNSDITHVNVYDTIGNLIHENLNVVDRKLNLENLSSGIYYIKIFSKNKHTTKKIVKK